MEEQEETNERAGSAMRRGDAANRSVGDFEIANSSFGIEFNFAAYNQVILHINQVIFYRLA